ncbi:MAG: protein kinase [Bryobacteraceae bacterium]|jgi:Tol biopolymer transport system component/predicted Ser/Thr protein kinase
MNPERLRQIEELYHSASERTPGEREAFLNAACANDAELLRDVLALLAQDPEAGPMERPVLQVAADLLSVSRTRQWDPGTQVGRYQIVSRLGEGGMGVVYRAYDTQLRRPVALKVLPPEYASDPERRERLLREARAASALNHPNIVSIHEVGFDNGVNFIAMEFVEGKSLGDIIPARGLPLAKALDYAVQVAGGLAKAHAAGVIHRDLKPGNIMLTGDGLVKLLDFGLARRVELGEGHDTALTVEGEILGTPAYMSPEQAEGKPLDPRSDVFSFGVVLYQMLAGRPAFSGNSAASLMAAVLREEPPPLGAKIPRDVERIVRRCLRKDPAQRFQHMDDVKVELEELKAESQTDQLHGVPTPAHERRRRWIWAAGILATVLLLAGVLVWRVREGGPPEDLKAVPLGSYPGREGYPSFSPDGNKVAFQWNGDKEDNFDIYVKQIGAAGAPMRLTNTPEVECCPAWSPNDRWIAFLRQQKDNWAIMLIPPLGGPERKLAEIPASSLLSWTPDAKWLAFGDPEPQSQPITALWGTAVDTGERRRLTTFRTKSATAQVPLGDSAPAISPDGRTLAFFRQATPWVFEPYTLRLAPDLRPDGEPEKVTAPGYASAAGIAWTADSREIVYSAGGERARSLWRVPVSGGRAPKRLPYAFPEALYPAIARTSSHLAYTFSLLNVNLWRLDIRTGERKRLIGSSLTNTHPKYSPDGRKIAFRSNRTGNEEIWTCEANGSNCVQITSFDGPILGSPSWSPDGRWLALDCAKGGYRIYVVSADGGTPRPLTDYPAHGNTPSWSSDGRWIYFASDRSGRYEVWKVPKDGGTAVQVTHSGGGKAFESPDGKYLYYYDRAPGVAGGSLCRMPVEGGEKVQILPQVNPFGFAVTAKGIYFRAPGERTIQFRDTATGKVRTLATVDTFFGAGMSASPDDAYVVWCQTDRNTQDLMLVEGFR